MRVAPVSSLVLTLLLAGCGGGSEDRPAPTTSTPPTSSEETTSSATSLPSDHAESHWGPRADTTVAELSTTTIEKGYAKAFPDERKTLSCDEAPEVDLGAEASCILKGPEGTWGTDVTVSAIDGDEYEVTYLVSEQRTPKIEAPG